MVKNSNIRPFTLSIFIEHDTELTPSVCPLNVSVEVSCVFQFHNLSVVSYDAERISVDDLEKQQQLTLNSQCHLSKSFHTIFVFIECLDAHSSVHTPHIDCAILS